MNKIGLIILVLTVGLASTSNVMPEGEDFPENIPTGDQFIDLNLELFEYNIKSVNSVEEYFKLFFNYLLKTYKISLEFNHEISELKQVLAEVELKLISDDNEDKDVEVIISKRNEATKRVLKFERNAIKWSIVFDTASKWVEKRLAFYPEGKTKNKLIEIQNTLIEAESNINQVADNLVKLVTVFNSCDPDIMYDLEDFEPYFITIDNDHNYNFFEMTEKALDKIRQLIDEPKSPLISSLVGAVNILPF